jgi:hypothetical protein
MIKSATMKNDTHDNTHHAAPTACSPKIDEEKEYRCANTDCGCGNQQQRGAKAAHVYESLNYWTAPPAPAGA